VGWGESGDREERLEECHGHLAGSGDLRDVLLNAVIHGTVEDLSLSYVVVCRDPTDLWFPQLCRALRGRLG
jgi:hypothetical protein